jgi:hypothetical protein
MAKEVTDPALLRQFAARQVTDKKRIQEFEDRKRAAQSGQDYDKISGAYDAVRNKRATGSIYGIREGANRKATGAGSFLDSIARGAILDPAEGITQLIGRAGNKAERLLGMDPNTSLENAVRSKIGMAPTTDPIRSQGLFSDKELAWNESRRKNAELEREQARADKGRTGFDAGRLVGNIIQPGPKFARLGALGTGGARVAARAAQAVAQGATSAAIQAVDEDPNAGGFGVQKAKQILGGAGGGLVMSGAGQVLGRGARRFGNRVGRANRVADAANELGVDVGMGQITANPALRRATDVSANSFGGGPINRAAERTEQQLGNALHQTAAQIGNGTTPNQVGAVASNALDRAGGFRDRFQNTSRALYGASDLLAPRGPDAVDVNATLQSMTGKRDRFQNTRLGEFFNNPRLSHLQDIVAGTRPSTGRMSWHDAQAMRSEIGQMMGARQGVGPNDIPRAELANVYRQLTSDMRNSLGQHNPDALSAFDRATTHYNAGMQRFDKLDQILGNAQSNENIATRIQNMGRNDARGLFQLRRSMTTDEWRTVASGVFRQMGEATAGTSDEFGEGFSPSRFLTKFNEVQKNPHGFNAMFGDARRSADGTSMQQAMPHIRNLATLTDALKKNSKLVNNSGSGFVNILAGLIGVGSLNPANAAMLIGANNTFARAMASPAFLRAQMSAGRALRSASRRGGGAMQTVAREHVPRILGILNAHRQQGEPVIPVDMQPQDEEQ